MALQGWIQIHRKLLDSKIWQKKPYSRGQAWITMLLLANHKSQEVWIYDQIVECKRGECVRSIESWGKIFGWSRQKVRTFFQLLQKNEMILTKGLQKTTRLTICNYETYQSPQPTDPPKLTNSQPTANQQLTTNNNVNNANNGKNVKIYVEDSNELRLAGLLFSLIAERKPDCKKPNLQLWAKNIDYMIRIDKRSPDRIEKIIHWCQKDTFWASNILSTKNLRKHFDRLELKKNERDTISTQGRTGQAQAGNYTKEPAEEIESYSSGIVVET